MKYNAFLLPLTLTAACGHVDTGVDTGVDRYSNNSSGGQQTAPQARVELNEDALSIEFSLSLPSDSVDVDFVPPAIELGLLTCQGVLEQRAQAELSDSELAPEGGLGIAYAYTVDFEPPGEGCFHLEVLAPTQCSGASEPFDLRVGRVTQVVLSTRCSAEPSPPPELNAVVLLERAASVSSVNYASTPPTATCQEQELLELEMLGDLPIPPVSVSAGTGLWPRVVQELSPTGDGRFTRRAVIYASASDAQETAELTVHAEGATLFAAQFRILPTSRAPLCISRGGEMRYGDGTPVHGACAAQCDAPLEAEAEAARRICLVPDFAAECDEGAAAFSDFYPPCEVR